MYAPIQLQQVVVFPRNSVHLAATFFQTYLTHLGMWPQFSKRGLNVFGKQSNGVGLKFGMLQLKFWDKKSIDGNNFFGQI